MKSKFYIDKFSTFRKPISNLNEFNQRNRSGPFSHFSFLFSQHLLEYKYRRTVDLTLLLIFVIFLLLVSVYVLFRCLLVYSDKKKREKENKYEVKILEWKKKFFKEYIAKEIDNIIDTFL